MLAFPPRLFQISWFLPLRASGKGPGTDSRPHRAMSSATFLVRRSKKTSNFMICSGPQTPSQTEEGGRLGINPGFESRLHCSGSIYRLLKDPANKRRHSASLQDLKRWPPPARRLPPPATVLASSLSRAASPGPIAVHAGYRPPLTSVSLHAEALSSHCSGNPIPFHFRRACDLSGAIRTLLPSLAVKECSGRRRRWGGV